MQNAAMTIETTDFHLQHSDSRQRSDRRITVSDQPDNAIFHDRTGQVRRPILLLCVMASDIALTVLAGIAALFLTDGINWPASLVVAAAAVTLAAVLGSHWSYTVSALRRPVSQFGKVFSAILMVTLTSTGLLHLASLDLIEPKTVVLWALLALVSLTLARVVTAATIEHLARAGRLRRRTVIVGNNEDTRDLLNLLQSDDTHVDVLAQFDERTDDSDAERTPGASVNFLKRLVSFDQLNDFCRTHGVELLIVSVPAAGEDRLLQIIQHLLPLPVDIRISAHKAKLRFAHKSYRFIGSVPMLPVLDRPLSDRDRMIKNIEDRILGMLLLLLAAPVMAVVALAVKLESKGPILFRQKRLGFNNEEIEVYKFRSMYTEMSDANAAKLVTRDDPRVTRVGRFIRKTSLDELPQLFNVLKGQMSIVGPRPHALQAKAGDDLYHDAVRSYFARHKMKPGITGWAQINGWRGETDTIEKIEQRVAHDMHYIDNWSVHLDLYIVAMTPVSLLCGKNAY